MRLHADHESLEGLADSPPRLVARRLVGIAEAGHEGVELGEEPGVLTEHLRRRGAESRHAGHRLLEKPARLLLLEMVGEVAAESGYRPDDFPHPVAAGGRFRREGRAEVAELLEKLAVFGEQVSQDRGVCSFDRWH